ncbi:hypothetical protein [Jannaschia sp. R86511]|uniref:HoxN/HupN/NixA family nickel/cobalt transporter n=1 Tax=Jannaschia sp. R86511 TaxID=3093853 RepID=UPI0036D3C910
MRSVLVGVGLSHLVLVVVVAATVLQAVGAAGSPSGLGAGAWPLLAGCALAWLWGLQHGLAADHVAAIDDVTRMRVGAGAASTGTHFAVGHGLAVCAGVLAVSGAWSAVVAVELPARVLVAVVLAGLCVWNVRLLRAGRESSTAGPAGGPAGAPRSLLLGLLLRVGRRRGGDVPAGAVTVWCQVVGLGVLFGLVSVGEVLVMALAVGPSEGGALALLAVAVCFSAGMVLTDSADSVLLGRMYAWSRADPGRGGVLARRATLLTAVVSGVVATTIVVGVLAQVGALRSGPLLVLARLGDRYVLVGVVVVAGFGLLWTASWLRSRRRAATVRVASRVPAPAGG